MKRSLMVLTLGVAAVAAVAAVGARRRPVATMVGDTCRVEGVWESLSFTMGGRPLPTPERPWRKIHENGYFVEVGAEPRRDTLPLRSELDTLRSRAAFASAGRYRVRGDTFTQTVEIFFDAHMEGVTLTGLCRTTRDTLVYAFTIPAGIMGGEPVQVSETWHRLR